MKSESSLRNCWPVIGGLALVMSFSDIALSAVAPHDPDELMETASHVVIGEVVDVEVRVERALRDHHLGDTDNVHYCTIRVIEIVKGDEDLMPGDEIVVRASTIRRRILPRPGPGSDDPIPTVGDFVQAHVRATTDEDDYTIVHPNGFAIHSAAAGGFAVELFGAEEIIPYELERDEE